MAELEDPSEIDVLYWVGCAGSYDERNQTRQPLVLGPDETGGR